MITRRALAGLTALLAALPRARASGAEIRIDNFAFVPARLEVPAGAVVRFVNEDDIPHLVVHAAADGVFRSPVLDTGEAWEHRFETAGTVGYFCSLHPHMQGTIVVT